MTEKSGNHPEKSHRHEGASHVSADIFLIFDQGEIPAEAVTWLKLYVNGVFRQSGAMATELSGDPYGAVRLMGGENVKIKFDELFIARHGIISERYLDKGVMFGGFSEIIFNPDGMIDGGGSASGSLTYKTKSVGIQIRSTGDIYRSALPVPQKHMIMICTEPGEYGILFSRGI